MRGARMSGRAGLSWHTMDSAVRVVLLNSQDKIVAALGGLNQSLLIDWLDAEEIDDFHLDIFGGQGFGSLEGFVEDESSAHDENLVLISRMHDLALADFELLIVVIQNLGFWPTGSDILDSLDVGADLDGSLARNSVRRIEHSGVRKSLHHGQVFEGHLGRAWGCGESCVRVSVNVSGGGSSRVRM